MRKLFYYLLYLRLFTIVFFCIFSESIFPKNLFFCVPSLGGISLSAGNYFLRKLYREGAIFRGRLSWGNYA